MPNPSKKSPEWERLLFRGKAVFEGDECLCIDIEDPTFSPVRIFNMGRALAALGNAMIAQEKMEEDIHAMATRVDFLKWGDRR